jgi:YbbR domain-containing protein
MRPRTDTIGDLGRAPARAPNPPPTPASPPPATSAVRVWVHGMLFENLGLKFLSLVLALTVFLMVNTDREREVTERVGVSYALPGGDKVLVGERLAEVHVTLRGSTRRLRSGIKLDPITLDLRNAPSGEIPITNDMIAVPPGVEIVSISPRTVHIAWDRRGEKVVEVAPLVTGRPQHGYVITEITAVPATVTVRGAQSTLAALQSVRTAELSVDHRTEGTTQETTALPPDGVEVVGSAQVAAHVSINEELVSRKLPGIPVTLHGDRGVDPARWQLTPSVVDVTLTGALLSVERAKLSPYVKVSAEDTKPREVDVTVDGVPAGIGVKVSPERVRVEPTR